MDAYFLVLAVLPFMLILMYLEHLYFKKQGRTVYETSDTNVNLACGFGQALADSLFKVGLLFVYVKLQNLLGIGLLEKSWPIYLLSFCFVDFSYYVYHRLSHTVNLMWVVHIVHHSSRHYNFSVALRQAWFHKLTAFPFYLSFLFFGIPVEVLAMMIAVHALLQFFSHTQAIPREIPLVRWLFVTPSFHRVHHGVNRRYLDKNFAGVFSFWDRLFGSYQPEEEAVRYGVWPQLQSQSAWLANTHAIKELVVDFKKATTLKEKLTILFGPPYTSHKRDYRVASTHTNLHLLTFALILVYLLRFESSQVYIDLSFLFLAAAFMLWFTGRRRKYPEQ